MDDTAQTDVAVERIGTTAWIRFNRPHVRNAARVRTAQELCAALDEAEADPAVRAIVIAGIGNHFMAGADLGFLQEVGMLEPAEVRTVVYSHFQGAARRLFHCAKPTIAAVRGAALTVGCEWAICCDFRVATPSALFQEKWIRAAALPPLGGLKLLPQLIGLGAAKAMVLRGQAIDGEEALRIGLVNELVENERLDEVAGDLADELARLSPHAYLAAKQGLHRGLDSPMDHEWQANVTAQAMLIGSAHFKRGVEAIRAGGIEDFSRS